MHAKGFFAKVDSLGWRLEVQPRKKRGAPFNGIYLRVAVLADSVPMHSPELAVRMPSVKENENHETPGMFRFRARPKTGAIFRGL